MLTFENQVGDGRKLTAIDDIRVNDGMLLVEIIIAKEMKKNNNKFTAYQIRGRDSLGVIDVFRRFKEFLYLRDMLFSRYPGLVIPPVPPKVYSNTSKELIEERCFFLNSFLK